MGGHRKTPTGTKPQRRALTGLRSASKQEQEKVTAGGAVLCRVRVSNSRADNDQKDTLWNSRNAVLPLNFEKCDLLKKKYLH